MCSYYKYFRRKRSFAGVINPPTKGRGYWTNDKPTESAQQWFEGAEHHDGSWWSDWLEWLKTRSGEQMAPPSMGSEAHLPLTSQARK